jgi:hypothetical protein
MPAVLSSLRSFPSPARRPSNRASCLLPRRRRDSAEAVRRSGDSSFSVARRRAETVDLYLAQRPPARCLRERERAEDEDRRDGGERETEHEHENMWELLDFDVDDALDDERPRRDHRRGGDE